MRVLLAAGDDNKRLLRIDVDKSTSQLTVHIVRDLIPTLGREAVGDLLLKLHIWRSTADHDAGTKYFGDLTTLDEYWLEVQKIALKRKPRAAIWVQPNTFLDGDSVTVKEYEATVDGVIQSWADRDI